MYDKIDEMGSGDTVFLITIGLFVLFYIILYHNMSYSAWGAFCSGSVICYNCRGRLWGVMSWEVIVVAGYFVLCLMGFLFLRNVNCASTYRYKYHF